MPVDATDPVALAQELIRCESVTPADAGAQKLLQSVLEPLGFTCHRMTFSDQDTPDIDNLYARLGTKGPNVCFAGHTDVVPPGPLEKWSSPPFAAEIRDGVLYGRGAVDMKGAIAAFVAATARLGNRHAPGSISLLITGDEEGPAINGTVKVLGWLKDRDERLDACLVGEPSNPEALGDEIKIGRRGSLTCELHIKGVQGHSAYPGRADNPLPKLIHMLNRLSTVTIDNGSQHFDPSNLQVTVIDVANRASNVIPGEARAIVNIRYNDTWTRHSVEDWIRLQCEAAASGRAIDYEFTCSGNGDVFLTKAGPLVDTMVRAVRDVTGRKPGLSTSGGTSDARFIKNYCPVIEFGLVNQTIHKVDEHVPVSDLETLTEIYRRFIENYFATA